MLRVQKRSLLIILLISVTLILKPAILVNIKNFIFETIVSPLRAIHTVRSSLRPKSELERENYMLKEKLARTAIEQNRFSDIVDENERLRGLLAFKKRMPFISIAACVIGRVPSTWTRSLIIDKGEKQGVRSHMCVATRDGLIGTVAESGPLSAKVMLISDPNSKVGVLLEGCRQSGLLVGSNEGKVKVTYLDLNSDIQIGDSILTSGLGGVYPRGLYVGTVEQKGLDVIGLYTYVIVKPGQDLNSIEEVICIK